MSKQTDISVQWTIFSNEKELTMTQLRWISNALWTVKIKAISMCYILYNSTCCISESVITLKMKKLH